MIDKLTGKEYRCLGHWTNSPTTGEDFDCEYYTSVGCDECYFNVSVESGDKRRGKKPWAKCNQD